jgi:hypothetical protein
MGVVSCGTTMLDQGVFQNIGAVTWDTTAKTAGFTAVSGNGYFVNTTSGAITVTLPSSPAAGAIVGIKDYANTADTNNITIGRNGSNIQGTANDYTINTEGRSVLLVYVDATKGWLVTSASQASDIITPTYITATGGTITTSGDYKIHTFTSPGTFTVTQIANPLGGPNNIDYLVVGGGGGGGGQDFPDDRGAGGGGAGGYRTSFPSPAGTTPVSVTGYPVSIGGGGAGGNNPVPSCGSNGSPSSAFGITSAGGGYGSGHGQDGGPGGSGGGGSNSPKPGGTGNTPPVSPPQGNPGGNGSPNASPWTGGGGGGASAAGTAGGPGASGPGGNGSPNSITGSAVTRAGGGGGGGGPGGTLGTGGAGGGGAGSNSPGAATSGTANTGGGGGGNGEINGSGGSGGSGVVVIRYKFQ